MPALPPRREGQRGRIAKSDAHNLREWLAQHEESVLRFPHDAEVSFTNDLAEQDLRMMKLRMKISGCFRSEQGARDFATLRSVLSTAGKQGWNRVETSLRGPGVALAALRY